MEHFFDLFSTTILNGNPWAFLIAFVLAAMVEFGIPDLFVIDAILLFAGYNLGALSPEVILIVLSLLAGRLFGASVVLGLSRIFGERFNKWLKGHFPAFAKKLFGLETKLDRYTIAGIVFIRVGPGFITAASVLSGISCINPSRFLIGVAISSFIADGSRLLVSFLTKNGFELFGVKPDAWEVVIALIAVLSLVFLAFYWLNRWHVRKNSPKNNSRLDSG